jgi:plasmid maintenance system antidote protein VapI
MAKKSKLSTPISDPLRRRIIDSGVTMYMLAKNTGVERMSISRFLSGESRLRLDAADKLAIFLGLELRSKGQ